ncbi:transposase IS4 family protein [Celeribacter baekdonensis B30]|jgi:hypothetical protein|uniref:Transposase IS4 family protein n=1 Tax=Celeribacter baekdonensis B30 TaxID=1208323 RepID=K2JAM0_9RHOB|nr:transposase IS4 family protein [Celeribacter baekdonensis B30]
MAGVVQGHDEDKTSKFAVTYLKMLRCATGRVFKRGSDATLSVALRAAWTQNLIPNPKQRTACAKYNQRRNWAESTFGRLKDWRCVATRHDRSHKVFLSAIVLALVVIYWFWILTLSQELKVSLEKVREREARVPGLKG